MNKRNRLHIRAYAKKISKYKTLERELIYICYESEYYGFLKALFENDILTLKNYKRYNDFFEKLTIKDEIVCLK